MPNVKIPQELELDPVGAIILADSLDLRAKSNLVNSRAIRRTGKVILEYDLDSKEFDQPNIGQLYKVDVIAA